MFKKLILFGAVFIAVGVVFGEISEDELDDYRDVIKMKGIRETSAKHNDREYTILEVEFSGGEVEEDAEYLNNIKVRLAVEITDKKTKQAYLVEMTAVQGDVAEVGDHYEGEGYWTLRIPHTEKIERLKISAYAVQYGVMDGKTFIPFEEEFDDVDSYEELVERTQTPYTGRCKLIRTIYVDER